MGNETSQQQTQDPLHQQGPDGGAGPALQVPGLQGAASLNAGIAGKQTVPTQPRPNNGGDASEGLLLSQLVQLLHGRPRHSLLLSDLGALLPQQMRSSAKEKGGLRSWLQKHPMLFHVSGQPGKESVTLTLGGSPPAEGPAAGGAQAICEAPVRADSQPGQISQKKALVDDNDEESASCVQMRGLPYRATANDVKVFLGRHTAFLKDDQSVQLVLNRDGRPSGFGRVQFLSAPHARAARDELHNNVMKTAVDAAGNSQERYVEIFLYSERPNKLRFRKGLAADGQGSSMAVEEVDDTTKEQVIQECREHMASPGKGQLLLSMLGVALSEPSRMHLKKTDLGLKHFLTQYPAEFRVEGVKGRESITYLPAMPTVCNHMGGYALPQSAPMGYTLPQPAPMPAIQHAPAPEQIMDTIGSERRNKRTSKGTAGPASGNLNELTRAHLEELNPGQRSPTPCSPAGMPGSAARGLRTPSDWGTPYCDVGHQLATKAGAQDGAQAAGTRWADIKASPGSTPQPQVDVVNAPFDPNANWAAWGMPPPSHFFPPQPGMQPGMPPAMPPWGAAPGAAPSVNPALPPWMQPGGMMAAPPAAFLQMGMQMAMPPPMQQQAPAPVRERTIYGSNNLQEQAKASSVDCCSLRLRGLPFTCSEQEVYAFFSKHDVVENIADVSKAVHFLTKSNGKPSGQATVQMRSPQDADTAQLALHGQWIGSRYIEVFPCSEDGSAEKDDSKGGCARAETPPPAPSAGDTGGSGSPSAVNTPSPWQMGQMGPMGPVGPMGNMDQFNAMMAQNMMHAAAAQQAQAGMQMNFAPPPMPGTGGDGSPAQMPPMAGGAGSWEALFDFLKRDNGNQPADAMAPANTPVRPM